MTEGHTLPLPVPVHAPRGSATVGQGELRDILREAMVQLHGTRSLEAVGRERKNSGKRFLEGTKQVDVAPKPASPAAAAGARPGLPKRPGMLKRSA